MRIFSFYTFLSEGSALGLIVTFLCNVFPMDLSSLDVIKIANICGAVFYIN